MDTKGRGQDAGVVKNCRRRRNQAELVEKGVASRHQGGPADCDAGLRSRVRTGLTRQWRRSVPHDKRSKKEFGGKTQPLQFSPVFEIRVRDDEPLVCWGLANAVMITAQKIGNAKIHCFTTIGFDTSLYIVLLSHQLLTQISEELLLSTIHFSNAVTPAVLILSLIPVVWPFPLESAFPV